MSATLVSQGWAILVLLIWIFLAVGSFLNVVIYRLPVMLETQWRTEARELLHITTAKPAPFNLVEPRSRCPKCGQLISAWQNIPILSWLALRGRCHHCHAAISPRYPFVEALTLALSLVVLGLWGYQWLTAALLLLTWGLIALTFIDYDTQLLPDQITLPLMWCGILSALVFDHLTLADSIVGAVSGYLLLWALYWSFKLLTGKEGMGYGDFKLLAALGAWVGWQALPAVVLIASLVGLLYAVASILLKAMRREEPIPFGPFLATAGWVTLIYRQQLISFYLV